MEALKISMREIEKITDESIPTIYKAIEQGHLRTFLVGRRRYARPEAVREWVDYLEEQSNAGKPVQYRPRSTEKNANLEAQPH